MQVKQNKVFEKPAGGSYLGTIVDIVDYPQHKTTYQGQTTIKDKVLVRWILAHMNGQLYLDKEGSPMYTVGFYTASMSDNATLKKIVTQVLQAFPPIINTTEDLERAILGRSNVLFITQEPDAKNPGPGNFVSKIVGINPLPPGAVPPRAPANFVRAKDKPKTQAGPQGQPVQTYATREAAAQAPAAPQQTVNFNRTASGPEAF